MAQGNNASVHSAEVVILIMSLSLERAFRLAQAPKRETFMGAAWRHAFKSIKRNAEIACNLSHMKIHSQKCQRGIQGHTFCAGRAAGTRHCSRPPCRAHHPAVKIDP